MLPERALCREDAGVGMVGWLSGSRGNRVPWSSTRFGGRATAALLELRYEGKGHMMYPWVSDLEIGAI